MTTQQFTPFIIGMILVVCIVLAAPPVTATDSASCTRSYNLVLILSPSGVTTQTVQIVYGSSLHPADAPGDLRGKVLAADGKILSEFPLWDPRIQFGEYIVVDEKGNVTKTSGIQKHESKATLAVMFPADPDARSFGLYDSTGNVMTTVDLAKAENQATWNCTPDYGIPVRNYPGTGSSGIPLMGIIAGLAVLIIVAGAGWYILKKRSGEKKQ